MERLTLSVRHYIHPSLRGHFIMVLQLFFYFMEIQAIEVGENFSFL